MADETDDLEYSEENVSSAQAQGVRKNISLKLKGKGRGRGRRGGKAKRTSTKKNAPEEEEADENTEQQPEKPADKQFSDSNLDDVISKLEAPAFNPMDRAPEPTHQNKKLLWDHKVNLIGEKVIDPLIHCCEKCFLPILTYGRILSCKHVFCFSCAKKAEKVDKTCPKCDDKIIRVEPSTLGTVFMCNFGGIKHKPGPCGRTYLSQRDLHAHFNHRHVKNPQALVTALQTGTTVTLTSTINSQPATSHISSRDPRAHLHGDGSAQHGQDPGLGSPGQQPMRQYQSSIPVSSARPNLITVQIQDDGGPPPPQPPHLAHGPPPPPTVPQQQPQPYPAPPIPQTYPYHPTAAPPPPTPYSQAPPPLTQPPPQMQIYHPTTYTPPPRPPPQHFPPPQTASYEGADAAYMQQWTGPRPPRPMGPRPPQQQPQEPGYRQGYYQ